jgi:2-dehydro-3-deoxyphosphogluconate aldolase/(4S)-4-hydroxy-2-oxoglutarate aldolase
MKNKIIIDDFGKRGVFGILEIDSAENAVPVAKALVLGGITAIELALRTPAALLSIKLIKEQVPEMFICAGTVLFPEQIDQVMAVGCDMGVAPGFNPEIVKHAKESNFPFVPGISTASELEGALYLGCGVVKLFPCEPLGGIEYMDTMMAPYRYLGIKVIPLGGISESNFGNWASHQSVMALGSTWICPRQLIQDKEFDEITARAKRARAIWDNAKKAI